MTREEAIAVIDALASGCSPFTGEVLEDHPILNDRKVIRALQTALVSLTTHPGPNGQVIRLPERLTADVLSKEQVVEAVRLLKEANILASYNKLTRFFLGSRQFVDSEIIQSRLFGMLKDRYKYNSLKPLVFKFLRDNPDIRLLTAVSTPPRERKVWDEVVYFNSPTFCKLSAKAIDQLKVRIDDLGIHKPTETLSENQQPARLSHPRAYEPWTEKETEYLAKALTYTNDLKVLSSCFQRTESSISAMGKRLIYEGKAAISPDTQA